MGGARIGNYSAGFVDTYKAIQQTRRKSDSGSKAIAFKEGNAYVHRGRWNIFNNFKKRGAGSAAIFKSIENQFGNEVAAAVFTRVTGKARASGELSLDQLDAMNGMLRSNVSTRSAYAANVSMADPETGHAVERDDLVETHVQTDGITRRKGFSEEFKSALQKKMNDSATDNLKWLDPEKARAEEAAGPERSEREKFLHTPREWRTDARAPGAKFAPAFQDDFPRSTYEYDGETLASTKDRSETQSEKGERMVQTLKDAGIPQEHWPKLTDVLHQGLFADINKMILGGAAKDAPFPFLFMEEGGSVPDHMVGLKFQFAPVPDKPGRYSFVATNQKPTSALMDPVNGKNVPVDTTRGGSLMEVRGIIDARPDSTSNVVTITDGQAAYQAFPANE